MKVVLIDRRKRWEQIPHLAEWVEVHETANEVADDYFKGSRRGEIVALHWGNQEMEASYQGNQVISWLSLEICKSGGRAIAFSGGGELPFVQAMTKALEEEGYCQGHYFLVLPWANVSQLVDWDELRKQIERELTGELRLDSLLPPSGALLVSLRILCEGFLIAQVAQGRGQEIGPVLERLRADDVMKRLTPAQVEALKHNASITLQASWWQKTLGTNRDAVLETARRECLSTGNRSWEIISQFLHGLWMPRLTSDFAQHVVDIVTVLAVKGKP